MNDKFRKLNHDVREVLYLDSEKIIFRTTGSEMYIGTHSGIEGVQSATPYSEEEIKFKCNKLNLEWRTY